MLSHLKASDKDEVTKIIKSFPNFWASNKFSIGHFNGFKARIPTKEGASAVQKERRQANSLVEGVQETIYSLQKEGVFELSSGLHETFCCNINITPKIESETELRTQSKADKHIAKMQGESRLNKPSGYRATFDFKSLNEIITSVGKLSLPTISEVEMSVKTV